MSRVGNPYDNAKAERFMRTLKTEQIDGTLYRDLSHARADIGPFIEQVYNSTRLHTALAHRSPSDFEAFARAGGGGAARALALHAAPANPPLDLQPLKAQPIT